MEDLARNPNVFRSFSFFLSSLSLQTKTAILLDLRQCHKATFKSDI